MSAAIAAQRDAAPANVRITKTSLTASESVMFWRMIASVRCECTMSHGSFERSSDINATLAVSIAAASYIIGIVVDLQLGEHVATPRNGELTGAAAVLTVFSIAATAAQVRLAKRADLSPLLRGN